MLKTMPVLAALLAAGTLVTPTVSSAAEQTSVRVSYADLNLGSTIGQNRLERRIEAAARTVCDVADPRDLVLGQAVRTCRSGAIADAQPAFQAAIAAARRPSVEVLDTTALIVTAK